MRSEMNRLVDCFVHTFAIEKEEVTLKLAYQSIPQWDSVGHMTLIAEIENVFDVTLDTDDIIGMSDVSKAVEIMKKHGVQLDVTG
jgi:acyl carrier protein